MAAWGNFQYDHGFDVPVGANLTKFRAVKLTGNPEEVNVVTAITDYPIGWSQFGLTAAEQVRGKGASVRVMGVTEAEASTAIAIGALVTLEADGRVSNYVAASGKRIVGRCVGAPAVNPGDRIALLINPTPSVVVA
jgi:hypothetical protein